MIILVDVVSPLDYIDEVYGDTKLWPTDAYKRAQTRILLSDFGSHVRECTPSTGLVTVL